MLPKRSGSFGKNLSGQSGQAPFNLEASPKQYYNQQPSNKNVSLPQKGN